MTVDNHHFVIEVQSCYLPEQSDPDVARYAFSYTITIRNLGTTSARLTHRHWLITDANSKKEEVHGEGVVGEQPYFEPGESYQYTSGVILKTPVGAMQGYYDMVSDEGEVFKVTIAPFGLSMPGSLH